MTCPLFVPCGARREPCRKALARRPSADLLFSLSEWLNHGTATPNSAFSTPRTRVFLRRAPPAPARRRSPEKRRQLGAAALLLPEQGAAGRGGVQRAAAPAHAGRRSASWRPTSNSRTRSRRSSIIELDSCRHALPARVHHQRAGASPGARAAAVLGGHRDGAGRDRRRRRPKLRSRSTRASRPGRMRPIAPEQFLVNLLSLCVFPFAARPMFMALLGLDQRGFRPVHRPAPQGAGGVLSESPAPMNIGRSHALAGCFRGAARRGRGQVAGRPGRSASGGRCSRRRIDTDPRSRELQLSCSRPTLRLRNISAQRLPAITVDGQAQYQSDVAHLAGAADQRRPSSSRRRTRYDAAVRLDQRLFDPTVERAVALNSAQLAENPGARPHALFTLRQRGERRVLRGGAAAGTGRRAGGHDRRAGHARCSETNASRARGHRAAGRRRRRRSDAAQRQQDDDAFAGEPHAPRSQRLATLTGHDARRRATR